MTWKPSRGIVLSLVVAFVVLMLAIYGVTVSPAEAPSRPAQAALSATRFFVLLPDGRVEMTDAYTRRVFKWDGTRWHELESKPLPRSTPSR